LKKFDEVEELFLFHQISTFDSYQPHEHFYLFVVLKHKATKDLKTYLQHIEQNPIESIRITSVHHTRYHIQHHTYDYQVFFQKIMKAKNRIYSSGYHPKIHWYKKRPTYLDGLEHSYNYNKQCYNNDIKPIFEKNEGEKYILKQIVSKFLVKHLQIFIFSETIYKPRSKNLITLWNLMIFANSALLNKFSTNEINQLTSLFQKLQNEFVKEGQLLLDAPTCSLIDKFVTTLFSHLQSSNEFKN